MKKPQHLQFNLSTLSNSLGCVTFIMSNSLSSFLYLLGLIVSKQSTWVCGFHYLKLRAWWFLTSLTFTLRIGNGHLERKIVDMVIKWARLCAVHTAPPCGHKWSKTLQYCDYFNKRKSGFWICLTGFLYLELKVCTDHPLLQIFHALENTDV